MTDLRQAAQQALEALIDAANVLSAPMFADAVDALKAALEQQAEPICPECKAAVLYECVACSSNNYPPKQQAAPVAQCSFPRCQTTGGCVGACTRSTQSNPPQRKWVGLTDEDLEFWTGELGQGELGRGVIRAVANHLKERNT